MQANRHRVPARARLTAALTLSLAVVAAGSAIAKNHDLQRVAHNSGPAKHDRALGPMASAEAPSRSLN